jgi:hypothetical protein
MAFLPNSTRNVEEPERKNNRKDNAYDLVKNHLYISAKHFHISSRNLVRQIPRQRKQRKPYFCVSWFNYASFCVEQLRLQENVRSMGHKRPPHGAFGPLRVQAV